VQNLLNNTIAILELITVTVLFVSIPLMILGCSSSSEYIPEKMDTPLQQRIHQLEKEAPNKIIQITGKTSTPINEEMKTRINSTGITTESIIQDIFTASGNVESIKKVTLLDFVIYLEIAKKLDIN
jgi:hypothetical protein